MARFFNTTGPCDPRKHYMLPPERRLPSLSTLVERELYYVVRAPRQTGKTTAMRAFGARLRAQGHAAVYATLETSQGFTSVEEAEPLWIDALSYAAEGQLPVELRPPALADGPAGARLQRWLGRWCEAVAPRKVVLLLDEADVIEGPALVSLLRQLRAGFIERPDRFPASIALIGMRELRDYLARDASGTPVSPGSPFNIKSESLTLRSFTEPEVAELYGQHTADTGQAFSPEAIARAWWWTRGQPFLVNALAARCVDDIATGGRVVTAADVDAAKDALVNARTTHLYSLAERLKEPRVAAIVQAVLTGDLSVPYEHDDFQYVVDMGLIVKGADGAEPACPLYREILARQLTWNTQENLARPWWVWRTPDGRLDLPALIDAFLVWWRENCDALVADVPLYPEAVPHIAFMAFLQRVVNGGGRVVREYAAGRKALDLLVEYGDDRFVIEIKRVRPRDAVDTVAAAAVTQVCGYLDTVGAREGWVLLFDQHPGRSWEERLWRRTVDVDGARVHLYGA
jgi:hypothetical protein